MPENLEEESKEFELDSKIDLVRRRHLHFLAPLLLGWLLVWSASWIIPARYKSSTLILVQQPTVPKDYVVSNINDDVGMRLESLTQQMMSRTRLLFIIQKLHLYDSTHWTTDQIVERMRKDIDVEMVRNPTTDKINSFRVSYRAATPAVAQQVTSELTNLFINYNQQQLQQESENTTAFISKQLDDARTMLAQQEARVRQFEAAHQGELPSQEQSNLQILNGLQSQLQNEQDALNTAKQQRVYLQSLIEQYRTQAPAPSPRNADSPSNSLAALDAQLAKMRTDLTELRTRYTERHPAVLSLQEAIAQTQKQRDQLAAQLGANGTNPFGDSQQHTALLQLQSQLQANQTEIGNREQEIQKLKGRIDEYQARLNAEPAAQQQLADLTRGYEQSQTNYNDLLKKQNDSAMATDLEQMQQGERFTVLDPPSLPTKPDFPNRIKFCGIGLAFGIALGVAFVTLLEVRDDRLHADQQIQDLLPVSVIAEVPEILRPEDERRSKQRALLGWAAGALTLVLIAGGSLISYLHT